MTQFYTYVWLVLKHNKWNDNKLEWVPVYVGKGKDERYLTHLKDEKSRIGAHLRKYPYTHMKFNTGTEQEALDLEIALIAKFGRLDLKKGPLLNLTDGGEGAYNLAGDIEINRRKKISETYKNPNVKAEHSAKTKDAMQRDDVKERHLNGVRSEARLTKLKLTTTDPEYRESWLMKMNDPTMKAIWYAKVSCLHCGYEVARNAFTRFHGDKCKKNPANTQSVMPTSVNKK